MPDLTYHNARDIKNIEQLRGMLPSMPGFCAEFFRGITPETTPLTRLGYARDLVIFFDFICEYKSGCIGKSPDEITVQDMASITMTDIETYLDYLTVYNRNDKLLQDDDGMYDVTIPTGSSLKLYLKGSNGAIIPMDWTASTEGVVTIDGTKITGVARGSTTITATYGGTEYKCIVRIN